MDSPSHVALFNQSQCFISAQHSYATLKIVYDPGPEQTFVELHSSFEKRSILISLIIALAF